MYRFLLIFLLFVNFHNIFSQNYCDSVFVKYGKIRETKTNRLFSGYFNCVLYYRDVKKIPNLHRVIFHYTNNSWFLREYDEIDLVRAVGYILDGKEEGKWQYYKGNSDTLLVECYFRNGKLSGLLTTYAKNGWKTEEKYRKGRASTYRKNGKNRKRKPKITLNYEFSIPKLNSQTQFPSISNFFLTFAPN